MNPHTKRRSIVEPERSSLVLYSMQYGFELVGNRLSAAHCFELFICAINKSSVNRARTSQLVCDRDVAASAQQRNG